MACRSKLTTSLNSYIFFVIITLSLRNMSTQDDASRRNIAGILAIVLGLAIGLFIKRVRVGLLIGIVLGLVAIMLLKRRQS